MRKATLDVIGARARHCFRQGSTLGIVGLFLVMLMGIYALALDLGWTILGGIGASRRLEVPGEESARPMDELASSGLIPLFVPHADWLGLATIPPTITTRAGLAAGIFAPGTGFRTGAPYLLKAGDRVESRLRSIIGIRPDTSSQGALDLVPGSPADHAQEWQKYMTVGYGGTLQIGEILVQIGGSLAASTRVAVTNRVNMDAGSQYTATTRTARALSARLVTVPIVRSLVPAADDGGIGVPGIRNIPYVWSARVDVKVIGFAVFFLDPWDSALSGDGAITGRFVHYVGTPPNGQNPG